MRKEMRKWMRNKKIKRELMRNEIGNKEVDEE